MRLKKLKGQFPQDGVPDFLNIDVVNVEMEVPVITGNLERGTTVRSIRPPTVPVLNMDVKRTTVSKMSPFTNNVAIKKQSDQHNVVRLRSEDDQHIDYQDKNLTQMLRLFELCIERFRMIYFMLSQKFIRKNYVALRRTFYKKLDMIKTFYNDIKKFTQIRRDEDRCIDGEGEELNGDQNGDQNGIYCFCLFDDADEQESILCGNSTCRIKWYHLTCVGLTSNTVPLGVWECAICREEDHWCTCGNKESYGEMTGCSRYEACKIEWFHLKCVKLYCLLQGTWYCDCIRNGEFKEDHGPQYCICYRSANVHEIVKCANRSCDCCVRNSTQNWEDWLCENCI
ncbi:uncharacterized protein LOC130625830 [Hydractinia symbiolongicarpus]|uniref:uncharacterized protein LOC130625830 n=1 Tax=Hydractinia symbiolongicarpus TaxID=13093 RepID=UPI002550B7D1|nr:uncharacterized protein LOC130625830 [Hydractinia symbiolongicarpus]